MDPKSIEQSGPEFSPTPNGIPQTPEPTQIENTLRLLEYHHRAMEARRSIQLKIFTGGIAFLLIITKGLYDYRDAIYNVPHILLIIIGGFAALPAIYAFMLVRIEAASKRDRESYHGLESDLRQVVKGYFYEPSLDKPERREGLGWSLLRSWAAVPPFLVALLVGVACVLFLWYGFQHQETVIKNPNSSAAQSTAGVPSTVRK